MATITNHRLSLILGVVCLVLSFICLKASFGVVIGLIEAKILNFFKNDLASSFVIKLQSFKISTKLSS